MGIKTRERHIILMEEETDSDPLGCHSVPLCVFVTRNLKCRRTDAFIHKSQGLSRKIERGKCLCEKLFPKKVLIVFRFTLSFLLYLPGWLMGGLVGLLVECFSGCGSGWLDA